MVSSIVIRVSCENYSLEFAKVLCSCKKSLYYIYTHKEEKMPSPKNHLAGKKTTKPMPIRIRKEIEWTEIPVFIHGINPNRYPGTSRLEYEELLRRVNDKLQLLQKDGFSKEKDDQIFVTWGVPTEPPQPSKTTSTYPRPKEKLTRKQRKA